MPPKSQRLYLLGLAAAGLILAAPPSSAGGSVEIERVIALAGQSPKLMSEISAVLAKAGTTLSDVQCSATRLGRYWVNLGGLRIPPYTCNVGGQTLEVTGTVTFYDESGAVPGEETQHESARFVAESQPEWSWR